MINTIIQFTYTFLICAFLRLFTRGPSSPWLSSQLAVWSSSTGLVSWHSWRKPFQSQLSRQRRAIWLSEYCEMEYIWVLTIVKAVLFNSMLSEEYSWCGWFLQGNQGAVRWDCNIVYKVCTVLEFCCCKCRQIYPYALTALNFLGIHLLWSLLITLLMEAKMVTIYRTRGDPGREVERALLVITIWVCTIFTSSDSCITIYTDCPVL